jgi:glycerate kinase
MRIVLAPDSYKGSLTARQACRAMARGVRRVWPAAEIVEVPMADGGNGTTEALVWATGGQIRQAKVTGPLPETKIEADWGLLGDGRTAVVEMARASGLILVPPAKRNPLHTTTFGTGELMAAALAAGAARLIVGIGGSATTDGGAGMAQALGARFFDRAGRQITALLTGGRLAEVADLDVAAMDSRIGAGRIDVACDVDNPLLGPRGAAAIYGPQKGASPADVAVLEANLTRFYDIVERRLGRPVREVPGAGAAGGLGAGLLAFCRAHLVRGVDVVLQAADLAGKLAGADLVLTGEGQLDAQTASGKTLSGVARAASAAGVPVIALPGRLADGPAAIAALHLAKAVAISPPDMPVEQAMTQAEDLLAAAAEKVCREI